MEIEKLKIANELNLRVAKYTSRVESLKSIIATLERGGIVDIKCENHTYEFKVEGRLEKQQILELLLEIENEKLKKLEEEFKRL